MDPWSKVDYSRLIREASMVVEMLPVVVLPSGRVPGRVLLVLPILEARRRRNRDEIPKKGSRHQILGLSKTGFTRPSGLRFGRILYPEASPRNSPQLSQLDFFRLTSCSGRNVNIFKKHSQTYFRKVRVLLQYDSFCVFVNFQVIPTQ